MEVDGVIIAAPAHQASRVLGTVDPLAAKEIGQIEYASCAVISLGYRREQIQHPLNGFGFVVPLVERRMILSCSFSSLKYEGRAPKDSVLLRIYIGGACQADLLDLSPEKLLDLAQREVSELLEIHGEPCLRHFTMHDRAMPQYHVGHLLRIERANQRLSRFHTLALAGSAYSGVGVPACIESGQTAANRIISAVLARSGRPHTSELQPVPCCGKRDAATRAV
jgi:oxygen-dependent protoporphyrinogen oxidase